MGEGNRVILKISSSVSQFGVEFELSSNFNVDLSCMILLDF